MDSSNDVPPNAIRTNCQGNNDGKYKTISIRPGRRISTNEPFMDQNDTGNPHIEYIG